MKYLIALLFVCSTAMADGLYVGIDGGRSAGKDICTGWAPGYSCANTGSVTRLAGGYQVGNLAVEASWADYGSNDAGSGFGLVTQWAARGIQVSGIGMLSVTDNLSLLGKLGAVRTDVTISGSYLGFSDSFSATTWNVSYGLGMQYDLNEHFAVRAQYEDLGTIGDSITGTTKATIVTGGVLYSF